MPKWNSGGYVNAGIGARRCGWRRTSSDEGEVYNRKCLGQEELSAISLLAAQLGVQRTNELKMVQSSRPVVFINLSRANNRIATITVANAVSTVVTTNARLPRAYPSSPPARGRSPRMLSSMMSAWKGVKVINVVKRVCLGFSHTCSVAGFPKPTSRSISASGLSLSTLWGR